MLVSLALNAEQFATARRPILDRGEETIRPAVEAAFAQYGQPRWYQPILIAAEALLEQTFRDESGRSRAPNLEDISQEYLDTLQTALSRTRDPGGQFTQTDIDRIARFVSTGAINAGTLAAAVEDARIEDVDLGMEWITMLDAKVRDPHQDAHGQTVPLGRSFRVGGVPMRYPGDPTAPIALWVNCRCVARPTFTSVVASSTQTQGGTMTSTAITFNGKLGENATTFNVTAAPQVEDEVDVSDLENIPVLTEDEADVEVPWYGVLAPEGVESGDGRMFALESLTWRDLPLPLKYQEADAEGHDGSVIVARIDKMWREDGLIKAEGVWRDSALADDVISQVAEGFIRGVSIDADSAVMEEGDNEDTVVFSQGRISSATICAIPAFAEAFIALGTWADAEGAPDDARPEADNTAMVAAVPPKTMDGPGWVTEPGATKRLRDYWAHGPGAAKIKWGAPRDFYRCRSQLRKYVPNPDWLNGLCANIHYDALGFWPGQHRAFAKQDGAGGTAVRLVDAECEPCLTASGAIYTPQQSAPPDDWFTDPGLTGPSPIVVDDKGRVFGHLAAWGTCHIGFGKVCKTAPRSATNYALFHQHVARTAGGNIVRVGRITYGTGHAAQGRGTNAITAAAHYDNTGTAVADIVCGEDEHGIWVSGAMKPGVPADTFGYLRSSALSGDWRRDELVAALAVNVPGFPIPHTSLAASGENQTSLVAAGVVVPETPVDIADLADQVIERIAHKQRVELVRASARQARLSALRVQIKEG